MLIYLAGPMRGYDDYNFPAFDRYAAAIRRCGHHVISPAEMDVDEGYTPAIMANLPEAAFAEFTREAMRRDAQAVTTCEAVAVMPGWQHSRGVAVEVAIARSCGIPILDAGTLQEITVDLTMCDATTRGEVRGHVSKPTSEAIEAAADAVASEAWRCEEPTPDPEEAVTADELHEKLKARLDRNGRFQVKDSGQRKTFAGGMVRDTDEGKVRYNRVLAGPMFRRWAEHLHKGAQKYPDVAPGVANWTLAAGEEELQRAQESAFGHFVAWLSGEEDEDHAAATFFNINVAEYVKEKLRREQADLSDPINVVHN